MTTGLLRYVARSTAPMMETTGTPETPVNLYQSTQRNKPEDSHLHTRRRENMKSHGETTDRCCCATPAVVCKVGVSMGKRSGNTAEEF
jgi:hypothetical protein